MGALIQTKGTQRLAKLFNNRFNATNIITMRTVASTVNNLKSAFRDVSLDLLKISDQFIAQNAVVGTWTADLEDILYPSTTLRVSSIVATDKLAFTLPAGFAASTVKIAAGWAACSFERRKSIPRGTTVFGTPVLSGNILTVTFTGAVTAMVTERISFAKGKHERLVRRWRWYLENDLLPENGDSIRRAISIALEDDDFKQINFQTIEDTQRVLAIAQQLVDNSDELGDQFEMDILLMTQSTTAIDRLDPQ